MIARFLVGGELLLVAAIVTGLLALEGFRRLSRCCMSARTVIAQVQQPQTFEQIVQQLIDDDHAEAIKEAGRVQ